VSPTLGPTLGPLSGSLCSGTCGWSCVMCPAYWSAAHILSFSPSSLQCSKDPRASPGRLRLLDPAHHSSYCGLSLRCLYHHPSPLHSPLPPPIPCMLAGLSLFSLTSLLQVPLEPELTNSSLCLFPNLYDEHRPHHF
jgi:hypothetical protein